MPGCCGPHIPPISPKQPCDICGSKDNVKSQQIPITGCALTHEFDTGFYRQSNLCQNCKSEGWILIGTRSFGGKLSYYNVQANESKRV